MCKKSELNSFCIRDAVTTDADALQRMYLDYLGNHDEYMMMNIKNSIARDSVYVAATDDDRIIGTLTSANVFGYPDFIVEDRAIYFRRVRSMSIGSKVVSFSDNVNCELRNLCVDDAYRRRGVATALLEYAIDKSHGSAYANVWAPGGQIRARNLWESHGFKMQTEINDLGAEFPWFCEKCVERTRECTYCDCYVYVGGRDVVSIPVVAHSAMAV